MKFEIEPSNHKLLCLFSILYKKIGSMDFLCWNRIYTFSCWNSISSPDTGPLLWCHVLYWWSTTFPSFLFSHIQKTSSSADSEKIPSLSEFILLNDTTTYFLILMLPCVHQLSLLSLRGRLNTYVLQDQSWRVMGKLVQPDSCHFPGSIHPLHPYGLCGQWYYWSHVVQVDVKWSWSWSVVIC